MFATALLAGSAFGVKHAFEADHVAAVTTLVEDDRPASTGAAWGVGHSLPILALGALFVGLGLRLPPTVASGFEALVALVLVALGLRVVAGREALGTLVLRHIHGDGDGGGGDDADRGDHHHHHQHHRHLRVAGREVGLTHSHADEESFAVGVVHGLAGSGGVVVALAAAAPTAADGAAFLAGFAVATVVAMGLAAWGFGRALGRAERLRVLAGVASVAVGLLLFGEVLGVL
ncbi:MAG: high-affinity nickel-transporter protein [Haloferacaceae archaeon]